jgi:raffinose/stachyose/melibiose transport system permease protein
MTRRVAPITSYLILIVLSLAALYPLAGIAFAAVQSPDSLVPGFSIPRSIHLGNIARAWNEANFGTYMRNSALVTVATIGIAAPLSILAGFAFGAMRFRGRDALMTLLLLGLIVPSETIIVPLYFNLRSVELLDSYWSLILPEAALLLAFGTFWMRAFFRSLPRSLFEAARIDGASTWRTLVHVALPPARPAVLTMLVLFFMWTWNEFFLPLVMISSDDKRTAPLGLALFVGERTTDVSGIAAASLLLALPVIVVYIFLQRHFVRGVIAGSVKG